MNGNRYVLDTNAIIALLQGNTQLIQLLQNANWIGISIISQIEFLVFSGLTQSDLQLFQQFIQRVEIVGLAAGDPVLVDKIIEIRQQYRLKLPDAVIAAITIQNSASLVTADQEFAKINSLKIINW
ncbi:type II toxin-antitoxin system VapC family toxin [Dolichospermum sp. UHCC 0684]|jgi:predicted nucleic acid-binding protein|uniref:type II toxin-antitoxin system VapC family toxin n=1 Tax=Nostocales TaxID=1161 RepID=UPI00029B6A2D|nr:MULTISPECIES: type II toxin-antitoxin system VapC family toxin [Nostocales]MBO1050936.1 type II toxin-antitoxin system VapC family toxin [Dolichospermum sp. DET73]MBS9389437.1 type II toxin-antitoxin system VapC family toxin [Dolichospermum sp. WA123]MCX5982976.1 type II toxin-antitoxin system VapC family toxin [Nostocales cyanobacterium LacPavin_0920_SED1_MAG_38_18]AFW96179.1 PIN domain-containing protein [Anabaena sp. 90]MBE9251943.1 type II toxin-antitoxin system VapC family toxin [Dolic